MDTALGESKFWVNRPIWPFVLGAAGAVIFALGDVIMAVSHGREAPVHAPVIGLTVGGAAILAVGWLGAAKQGLRTIPPFFGCLALMGGLWLAATPTPDSELRAVGLAIAYSFVVFAASHMFVTGLVYARILAAIALLPTALLAIAGSFSLKMSGVAIEGLLITTFVMFGMLGVAIALELPALRRRADAHLGIDNA